MTTYLVQAQLGDLFEDFYIKARNPAEAIRKARRLVKGTRLDNRFTNFVI
jgi:hypothetical protein